MGHRGQAAGDLGARKNLLSVHDQASRESCTASRAKTIMKNISKRKGGHHDFLLNASEIVFQLEDENAARMDPLQGIQRDWAHLCFNAFPIAANASGKHSKRDKLLVLHQLGRRESRQRIDQKLCSLFEISNRKMVQSAIDLQPIPSIPVTSRIDQAVRQRRLLIDDKETYSRARVMLFVTIVLSCAKSPTRTMARTKSMRAPKPAVFSKASSSAGIARSCGVSARSSLEIQASCQSRGVLVSFRCALLIPASRCSHFDM